MMLAVSQQLPHEPFVFWFGALAAVSAFRFLTVRSYARNMAADATRYYRLFLVGALAAGCVWGSASLVFFPNSGLWSQSALGIVIAGVAAAAATGMAASRMATAAFLLPAILPLATEYLLLDGRLATVMVVVILLFLATMLFLGWRQHDQLMANIHLRLQLARHEAALRKSEARYRLVFHESPLGVLHYDHDGNVIDCNQQLVDLLGSTREAVLSINLLRDLEDRTLIEAVRSSLTHGSGYYEDVYRSVTGTKSTAVRALLKGIHEEGRGYVGGVCLVEDFTARRDAEALIEYQAYYDQLTELPNRRLLLHRLEQAVANCRRHDHVGALLFFDLDDFKRINDSLGHSIGDQLLSDMATRLRRNLRTEDTPARLSGDEFVVLTAELADDTHTAAVRARELAAKVQSLISQPYELEERTLQITASIGYQLFPSGEDSPDDILSHADTAMYWAKSRGRGEIRGYLPDMQQEADARLALENDLRFALQHEQFTLVYQPELDLNGRVAGAEALVRWNHPERGVVSPAVFMDVAEETDVIVNLGRWVLRAACNELARGDSGCRLPSVAVNLSPREFRHPSFVGKVRQVLDEFGVDGGRLVLEVTERTVIDDVDEAVSRMQVLRRLGVRFAVDDFGTGYSSLTYLKRLPVDYVKIDQGFVDGVTEDPNDATIVRTIILMAHSLGLTTVAEGVETEAQLEFLRQNNCDYVQGFYLARPMDADRLSDFLTDRECIPSVDTEGSGCDA
jgi:diguanylate cyclase (GGDEF)-like protein/PAS domain S-box-containing protein